MARNEQYPGVLKTPYSIWHRNQHNGIAYTDLDMCSICPACAAPLFLADHIYNKDNQFRFKEIITCTDNAARSHNKNAQTSNRSQSLDG